LTARSAFGVVVVALAVATAAPGSLRADTTESTPTDTTPATVTVTTGETATVQTTTTVQTTVQTTVTATQPTTTAPTTATTTTSSSSSGFPTWAIVLIVVGGIGLIVAVAFLVGRGRRGEEGSIDGRRRILDAAVSSSVASGWIVESSGPLEAVIRHNGDRAMLSVDEHGQINRRRLENDDPAPEEYGP
jgi:Trk-type K+ transport system membrane component